MIESALASFAVIFVAELGDKSQLIVLAFATRLRPLPVLIGVAMATAIIMGLAVTVGVALSAALPAEVIGLVAAGAFFAFAAWTLWAGGGDEAEEVARTARRVGTRFTILAVAGTFLIAEIGDKTMLATIALATQVDPLGVWVGATLGEIAISGIAVLVGHQLGARLPARLIRQGAAALFALLGVIMLATLLIT